jgi:TonB-like protein
MQPREIVFLTAALGLIITALTGQTQELQPSKTELGWHGWDITINRLNFTNSVKQSFGEPRTADSDSEFVFLSMTVKNSSHEGQNFIPQNNLKIVIGDNTFDAEDLDSDLNYVRNIEPTLSKKRDCYFELPKSVVKDSLILRFTGFLIDTSDVSVSITATPAPMAQPLVEVVPQKTPSTSPPSAEQLRIYEEGVKETNTASPDFKLTETNAQPSGILVRSPRPPYPAQALHARISGIVHVRMTIQEGNIVNVEASGPPILANAAARWVRSNWKFSSSTNGTYTLPISFFAH